MDIDIYKAMYAAQACKLGSVRDAIQTTTAGTRDTQYPLMSSIENMQCSSMHCSTKCIFTAEIPTADILLRQCASIEASRIIPAVFNAEISTKG